MTKICKSLRFSVYLVRKLKLGVLINLVWDVLPLLILSIHYQSLFFIVLVWRNHGLNKGNFWRPPKNDFDAHQAGNGYKTIPKECGLSQEDCGSNSIPLLFFAEVINQSVI